MIPRFGVKRVGAYHAFNRLLKRKAREGDFRVSGVQTRENQQILHNMRHAVGLVDDNVQKAVGHLRRNASFGVAERLGVTADVRQRRAQFVGDVGDKLLTPFLITVTFGHVMEHRQHAA